MKRKNLENKIENKNSKNISNIFFLNKNTRENKNMKINIDNLEIKLENHLIDPDLVAGRVDFPSGYSASIITTKEEEDRVFEVALLKDGAFFFDKEIENEDYQISGGLWEGLSLNDVRSLLIDISFRL
jgi:hypothetical protein